MKSIRVLLIEDSRFFAQLVEALLSDATHGDFELEWVEDLAQGIERLGTKGIDAVLLDLTLPDSDGLDTFRRVYAVSAGIPVIIFTGLDDEELSLTTLEMGAADYLVKSEVNANWIARSLIYAVQRRRGEERAKAGTKKTTKRKSLEMGQPAQSGQPYVGRLTDKKLVSVAALEDIKLQLFKLLEMQSGQGLLLDFAAVEYVSNAAISTLLLVHKKFKAVGIRLILCNVSPHVREHFASRRFDTVFDIRDEAIDELVRAEFD